MLRSGDGGGRETVHRTMSHVLDEKGRVGRCQMILDKTMMKHVSWIWMELKISLIRMRYSEARGVDEMRGFSAIIVLCKNRKMKAPCGLATAVDKWRSGGDVGFSRAQ